MVILLLTGSDNSFAYSVSSSTFWGCIGMPGMPTEGYNKLRRYTSVIWKPVLVIVTGNQDEAMQNMSRISVLQYRNDENIYSKSGDNIFYIFTSPPKGSVRIKIFQDEDTVQLWSSLLNLMVVPVQLQHPQLLKSKSKKSVSSGKGTDLSSYCKTLPTSKMSAKGL